MKRILKKAYLFIPFKKQIYLLLKNIFKLPQSVYQHLYFRGFFKVKVNDGNVFKMFHTGQIEENEIFWNGLKNGWEKKSLQLWEKLAKNCSTIIDVGANTGLYGLVAQTVNPLAKVYCFEPLPLVFGYLQKNIQRNNFPIKAEQLALSNYTGTASVYLKKGESFAYSVTVNKNTLGSAACDELTIQTTTMSAYIQKHNIRQVDLMKIDVEGHEPEVLEGMGNYLQVFLPNIIIEVLTEEVAIELNKLFDKMDYLYFNIDDKNNAIRQTEKIEKSDFWNYLICNKKTALKLGII